MFLKIRVTNFAVLKEFFTFATLLKAMPPPMGHEHGGYSSVG